MNQEEPPESTPDVLPPIALQLLAALWILLFGGRWIGINLLLAARVLDPERVAFLDDKIFMAVYLLLLVITLTVLVLRTVRAAQARSPQMQPNPQDDRTTPSGSTAQAGSASSRASARRANPRD